MFGLLLLALIVAVQTEGTDGLQETRVYVTIFTQNFKTETQAMRLYIASTRPHPVHVQVFAPFLQSGAHTNVTLTSGQTTRVMLSPDIQMPTGTLISNRMVRVVSDDDVTVLALNIEASNSDMYQVRELTQIGREYILAVPVPIGSGAGTVGITSPYKDATVKVVLPASFTTITAIINGSPQILNREFTVVLGEDDAFQIQSVQDLSGTFIMADKPLAVLSGVNRTRSNSLSSSCKDGQITQLLSVDQLGNKYVAFGLITPSTAQDTILVVPIDPATNVTFDGTTSTVATAREVSRLKINRNKFRLVETSSPALAIIALTSGKPYSIQGDVSMYTLQPLPLSGLQYTVIIPSVSVFKTRYLVIMVDSNGVDDVLLDDMAITGAAWRQVQDTSLYSVYYKVNGLSGAHVIRHGQGRPLVVYLQMYDFCQSATLLFQPYWRDIIPRTTSCAADERSMQKYSGRRMTSLAMKTLTVEHVGLCFMFCFKYRECMGVNFKILPEPDNCQLHFTQIDSEEANADWISYAVTS